MNSRDVEKVILQKAVLDRLTAVYRKSRSTLEGQLDPGDMKRPRGLGSVSLSEPASKAKVIDPAVFEAHCVGTGEATVAVEVTGPIEEVLAVLDEHAPHLIGERTYVPDWLTKQELEKAEAGEVVPGVELVESASRLMVRTKDAAMVEAAQILAGTPLALEEGRP